MRMKGGRGSGPHAMLGYRMAAERREVRRLGKKRKKEVIRSGRAVNPRYRHRAVLAGDRYLRSCPKPCRPFELAEHQVGARRNRKGGSCVEWTRTTSPLSKLVGPGVRGPGPQGLHRRRAIVLRSIRFGQCYSGFWANNCGGTLRWVQLERPQAPAGGRASREGSEGSKRTSGGPERRSRS